MSVTAELAEDGGRIHVLAEWRFKDVIKSIPGAKWDADHSLWKLPVSWSSCLSLRTSFDSVGLVVGPRLSAWAAAEKNGRVAWTTYLRELTDYAGDPKLLGWQRSGLEFIARGKGTLIADDPGAGKAQPLSEPVLTPQGFRPMGEIGVGDAVIGADGCPTRVWGVFRQGVRPVFRVSFNDGTFVFADKDHLWRVQSKRDSKTGHWQTLSTRDILDRGVMFTDKHGFASSKWRVPLCGPVEFEKAAARPLDPYVLGALLGDGHLGNKSIRLASADQEIVDRVSDALTGIATLSASGAYSYNVNRLSGRTNPVLDAVRGLGLAGKRSHEKFVPPGYLHAGVADRLDLLRGLMDTDGNASRDNHQSFCSVSRQLSEDVAFLVRSLGGRAHVKERGSIPAGGNYMPWNVHIRMPDGMNPFGLVRKAELVRPKPHYRVARFISSIEYSHDEETQCLAVEADDHLYVTRDFTVTHNTATAIRGLARARQLHDAGHPAGEPVFPVLVVCPNSMKKTWAREFGMWWPGLRVTVVKGSAVQRRKLLEEPAHVYVLNFEQVKTHSRLAPYGSVALRRCTEHGGEDPRVKPASCHVHEKELNAIDFGAVVVDEAHRIKSGKAVQTRAVKAAAGDAPLRVALTGTPIANDVTDLWSILNFLAPGEFASKTRWIDRYVETMMNAFGGFVVIGIKAPMQAEFNAVLATRMRRMQEDVVLRHLPPLIYQHRECEMSARQAKAYNEIRDKMYAELEDGSQLSVDSPMVKATRLLQFASAYAEVEVVETVDEHGFPKVKQIVTLSEPSAKLDAFMDDLEDFGDEAVAVMAVSRQLIELLSARLEKRGIAHGLVTGKISEDDRNRHMEDFQAGRTKFILFTTAAGGTGITLTAARYLCRLQVPFSLVDFKQSLRRVRRIGSERHENIIVIDYVTEDTLDGHVFDALQNKEQSFEEVVRDDEAFARMLADDGAKRPKAVRTRAPSKKKPKPEPEPEPEPEPPALPGVYTIAEPAPRRPVPPPPPMPEEITE